MLMVMMKVSPRVWAFSDYPKEITNNVPPQTKEEKHKIITLSIPFFILVIGYPFLSTFLAKQLYTGAMPLIDAFTNTFGVLMFFFLSDFIILDWLVVGTITPKFVIIPGTESMKEKEYKNFRLYHTKAHIRGFFLVILLSFIIAVIVSLL